MANIMDYLAWRGDLSWAASEFNEVDNLILSELIYVDFSGIVPAIGKGDITLWEASDIFFSQHTDEEINAKVSSTKVAPFMMREMATTDRFGEIRLANYINDISQKEQSQFCAMTVELGDGRSCVVYSGTDATIVGWRENFNMSFLTETPGQLKAVDYLSLVATQNDLPLRVMGHSKGGNLAVYASTHVAAEVRDRIESIYSNDGPGFSESMISQENYSRLIPKIHTIIPESSIVGMLLEHEEEFEVVASAASGARQHDVMNWEVLGASLVHRNTVDGRAVLLDQTLKGWLNKMEPAEREEFVDALFGILEEAQIYTVDDLAAVHPSKFIEMLRKSSSFGKEEQEVMRESVRRLLEEGGHALKELIFRK